MNFEKTVITLINKKEDSVLKLINVAFYVGRKSVSLRKFSGLVSLTEKTKLGNTCKNLVKGDIFKGHMFFKMIAE